MICAIVDVAHLVTTHSLQAGDPPGPAGRRDGGPRGAPTRRSRGLDLAAVADAEGHHGEADRILRDEVCNRTDDEGAPPELATAPSKSSPARTGWNGPATPVERTRSVAPAQGR